MVSFLGSSSARLAAQPTPLLGPRCICWHPGVQRLAGTGRWRWSAVSRKLPVAVGPPRLVVLASTQKSDSENEPSSAASAVLDSPLLAGIEEKVEEAGKAVSNAASKVSGQTLGERLAQEHRDAQETEEAKEAAKIRARKQKRREYMSQQGGRNDWPLLLGFLAAFLLPAIIILTWAFTSGYLDTLAGSYRR